MSAQILCIEDDSLLRNLIVDALEPYGYDLAVAENGREGLEKILSDKPDLILSDISMPRMSGLELLKEIRQNHPKFGDVPFIFLTALGNRDNIIEGRKLGCDDYITKPVDFELLTSIIESRLGNVARIVDKAKEESKQRELELAKDRWRNEWLKLHDPVTNLPNQKLFLDRLRKTLKKSRCADHRAYVLLIEVDSVIRFRELVAESTLDRMAKITASRIRKIAREFSLLNKDKSNSNWVARIGLNRFALVLPKGDQDSKLAEFSAILMEKVTEPIVLEDDKILLNAAIGIAGSIEDETNDLICVRHAEIALLKAKTSKPNSCMFYEPSWSSQVQRERRLERDLHKALDRNELLLHYQPRINARTEEIIGVEALIRWQHPDDGFIRPDEFISLAESNGLIIPIGEWVFRTACEQASEWRNAGNPQIEMAINISSVQFQQSDISEVIAGILDHTDLDPRYVEVEITESLFMEETEHVLNNLNRIHDLGVGIAIDDFGTGYSSLSYLKRFPATTIKIDKTFVSGSLSNTADSAIATAVVDIGHANNMKVVAEGVETKEQIEYLRLLSCDQFQGYYFSPPVPAHEIEAMFSTTP